MNGFFVHAISITHRPVIILGIGFIVTFLCLPRTANGQSERSNWFFGNEEASSGLTFDVNSNQPIPKNGRIPIDLSESNSHYSKNSIIQFFSNGETIRNVLDQTLPNGRTLKGSADAMYGSTIVENPAGCNQYNLFYTQSSQDVSPRKIFYSTVDLSIEVTYDLIFTSNGDVIPGSKDIDITPPGADLGESIHSIDNSQYSKGSWILASDRVKRAIYIFNVSAQGVQLHKEYNLKSLMPSLPNGDIVTIKYDSKKIDNETSLLVVAPSGGESGSNYPIGTLIFDRMTGEIDNSSYYEISNKTKWTYGTAFSPDENMLYFTDHIDKTLWQHNFSTGLTNLIGTSAHNGKSGGLKLGPNNRIYWAHQFSLIPNDSPIKTLSSINNPNLVGNLCGLEFDSYLISGSRSPTKIGVFPNILSGTSEPFALQIEPATCGRIDGIAEYVTDDKVEPLQYEWDNGEISKIASALTAGVHYVTATGLNGCVYVDTVEIFEDIDFSLSDVEITIGQPTDCTREDGYIVFFSTDIITDKIYKLSYTDPQQNQHSIIVTGSINRDLVLENLGIGMYTNLSIGTDTRQCDAIIQDTVILVGMLAQPDIGTDTMLCIGESYIVSPQQDFMDYQWSTGSDKAEINITQNGNYALVVTDNQGCTNSSSINVLFSESPTITLNRIIEIKSGDSITIEPEISGGLDFNYNWTPTEGLSCADCIAPMASPSSTRDYVLEVINSDNCSDSATITINVKSNSGLLLPNVFSPNGDGRNDNFTFTVVSEEVVEVLSFEVYNRWGSTMYTASNIPVNTPFLGWDGKLESKAISTDVYVYAIEVLLTGDRKVTDYGDVFLMR